MKTIALIMASAIFFTAVPAGPASNTDLPPIYSRIFPNNEIPSASLNILDSRYAMVNVALCASDAGLNLGALVNGCSEKSPTEESEREKFEALQGCIWSRAQVIQFVLRSYTDNDNEEKQIIAPVVVPKNAFNLISEDAEPGRKESLVKHLKSCVERVQAVTHPGNEDGVTFDLPPYYKGVNKYIVQLRDCVRDSDVLAYEKDCNNFEKSILKVINELQTFNTGGRRA